MLEELITEFARLEDPRRAGRSSTSWSTSWSSRFLDLPNGEVNYATLKAAMVKGGALGILGDLLFAEANWYGQGLTRAWPARWWAPARGCSSCSTRPETEPRRLRRQSTWCWV
jgi:hypothetical protein